MPPGLDEKIAQLKGTIAEMDAQRSVLGDDFVDATLDTLRSKLFELEIKYEQFSAEAAVPPTRQRKLVTLLYLDVVDSTAITQHLDPEDTMEILDNALSRLAEPIAAHGGHVTRFTGDGFKAIFGDPLAREDDPEQAIRAGLEILEVSNHLAEGIKRNWGIQDFQVRIGIDTGLAALGGKTEGKDTVKGQVVNLAVRIESAASPGALLISHNTFRHVRGVFNVDPLDPITAKGFPEPVQVYRVREAKPRAFRVQTRGVEGVETRMVGRQSELKYLQDALLTAIEDGEGQVVTICGEAGVGKSRLLYEFQNWLELLPPSPSVRLFIGRGSQEAQGLPYNLLRDLFAFRFQVLEDDTGEQARRKIEAGFSEIFSTEDDGIMRAHILGQLLGFDFSTSPHLKGVLTDPEQLRNRARMYLVGYFQAVSQGNPVVIFLEDMHWGDDSSLDLVMHLGEHTQDIPLLIVGASRPTLFERRPYWGEGQAFHKQLELHMLSTRESRQLVFEILQMVDDIPIDLRELVVKGAEGNPFYLEELVKMLIEDEVIVPGDEIWGVDLSRLEQVDVPSTLAGVLQARLDSLPTHERTVLQQASVVGRLFWDRILTYIQEQAGNGDDSLLTSPTLSSLRSRELIYRHEESEFLGAVEYLFKHDVLREVTYESVLKRLRKIYHGLVADWLIANCGDRSSEYSGLIAEHLLLTEKKELAGEYLKHAGDSALASFANSEAENYYKRALKFTKSAAVRADILFNLGEALSLLALMEDANQVLRHAIDSYKEIGNLDQIGKAYAKLSRLYHLTDDLRAWSYCQEGLELLSGSQVSPGFALLLSETGRIAWWRYMDDQARELCQRAVDMADAVGELKVSTDARITLAFMELEIANTISIFREVIDLSNANNLLEPASRAHVNLGYIQNEYLIDIASSHKHSLLSAELAEKSGDPQPTVPYSNALENLLFMGKIEETEQLFSRIFQVPHTQSALNEYYAQVNQARILVATGELQPAVKLIREIIREDQFQESFQRIGARYIDLALVSLELNHFGLLDDLSDAESALITNLDINYHTVQSHYLLSTVYARLGRLPESHDLMSQPMDDKTFNGRENNRLVVSRAMAQAEIAMAENRWKDAVSACKTAIDVFQECGHKLWWARQLIDLGDAYLGRDEPGDIERARETYQQSLKMYSEMGAPGYIEVLNERLADI